LHLLQNLGAALDEVFTAPVNDLKASNIAVRQAPVVQPEGTVVMPVPPPLNPHDALVQAQPRRTRRRVIYQQVWEWRCQGWSGEAIARQVGIGRATVLRSLHPPTFPERTGRSDRGRSMLNPDKPYGLRRWNAGCREALALFEEIKGQGYRGS
jgi:hypothetical protein